VFAMRDQFTQYQLARLQALVSLCKALGGGWQAPGSAPQVASAHDGAQQR
jgi:outer membrane protein TolC